MTESGAWIVSTQPSIKCKQTIVESLILFSTFYKSKRKIFHTLGTAATAAMRPPPSLCAHRMRHPHPAFLVLSPCVGVYRARMRAIHTRLLALTFFANSEDDW